jgi:uncharacterized protein
MPEFISEDLIGELRRQYRLRWDGIHGFAHWQRVHENGLRLAQLTGADRHVVAYFAFLHDICRLSDGRDRDHGKRAAGYIDLLQGTWISLQPQALALLQYACEFHTAGMTEGDVTVQTCWDSDRLDLGRVCILPDPSRLCTPAARQPELLEWAYHRSIAKPIP